MKKLENPTTHFFKQADNLEDPYRQEINEFVNKLIDKDNCILCRQEFNTHQNIPRIMIHCGHTFCTPCLTHFYMNRRVRCPMCLKLVKQLETIERLPINHTIFKHIVEKQVAKCLNEATQPKITDASKYLFAEFERVQKEAHMQENPQKIDPDSGLPFCVFHPDRVEHFFCEAHDSFGCRVCVEIGHSKPDCKVIDLYTVDDPQKYKVKMFQAKIATANLSSGFPQFKNHQNFLILPQKKYNFKKVNPHVIPQDYDIIDYDSV